MYKNTDKKRIVDEITNFLESRKYEVSGTEYAKNGRASISLNTNGSTKKLNITIKKRLNHFDTLVEDSDEPYLLKDGTKYAFKFRKNYSESRNALLSYEEVENSESFFRRTVYGTADPRLRKLYRTMPELKHRTMFRLNDTIAESMMNTTAVANVLESMGSDSYYVLLAGTSSVAEIHAEKIFTGKATKITSLLPQAKYATLLDSPRNTINTIVERKDVNSWIRLLEVTENICEDLDISAKYFSPSRRVSKLEEILLEGKSIEEEISDWPIKNDERFKKSLNEIEKINYIEIKQDLNKYIDYLKSKNLVKEKIDSEKILEKITSDYAGKNAPELRVELSDKIRKIIKEPTKQEYLDTINSVKNELKKNLWSDTGVFFSKLGLSALATMNAPTYVLMSIYMIGEIRKVTNAVGFERMNNVLRLNYMIEELNKDPTVSGGADLENIFDAQISKIESATNAATTTLSVFAQYYARKNNNDWVNYALYGISTMFLINGMREWYKYMNQLVSRLENEKKVSSDVINI